MDEWCPECSAVGMWGWGTDGSCFPMNILIMALQGAEDGTGASFQIPGDFGVLHFKDRSFFRVKVPLSSDYQPHFSFHNAQLPNQLFFFILTKPGLGNVPWDICKRFLLAKLPTDVLLIIVITLFQWCLQYRGFYLIFSHTECLYLDFLWNWKLWLEFLESSSGVYSLLL